MKMRIKTKANPTGKKDKIQISNLHYFFHEAYYYTQGGSKKSIFNKNCFSNTGEYQKSGKDADNVKCQIDAYNETLESMRYKSAVIENIPNISKFKLVTVYPGVITGSGLAHGVGIPGEIAMGITLDYVTGMPILPGSSVKGCLRAAFSLGNGVAIKTLLRSIPDISFCIDSMDIPALEEDIFGKNIKGQNTQACQGKDVFFDAVISADNKDKKILALDTISPHRQNTELLELAEPNPITFLKIAPEVNLLFSFKLCDSIVYNSNGREIGVLKAMEKLHLFKQVLCTLGIGAKTNVGYGILKEPCNKEE